MPCLRATGTMSRSASRLNRDHSICRQLWQCVTDKLLLASTEPIRSVGAEQLCRAGTGTVVSKCFPQIS